MHHKNVFSGCMCFLVLQLDSSLYGYICTYIRMYFDSHDQLLFNIAFTYKYYAVVVVRRGLLVLCGTV